MNQWYYAPGGQQLGPVTLEQLREIARNGGLASKDLVWNSTMKDWLPAGQVAGIFDGPPAVSDPANPYAAPVSGWSDPAGPKEIALVEIEPGSQPIDVMACIKRAFALTARNFGMILLVFVVMIGVTLAMETLLGVLDEAVRAATNSVASPRPESFENPSDAIVYEMQNGRSSWWHLLISQVVSLFLTLGLIRIGLNLVSGKSISIGMLFGEGRKLPKTVVASILFGVMMIIGFALLIVPGVYVILRFGQFMTAIVDKDLGIIASLKYSSSITKNNRLNLFLLILLSFVVIIAGFLALCVGLLFAYPVVYLGWLVAYRWMQYGPRAAMDHPGTNRPMLTEIEGSRMIG